MFRLGVSTLQALGTLIPISSLPFQVQPTHSNQKHFAANHGLHVHSAVSRDEEAHHSHSARSRDEETHRAYLFLITVNDD